MRSRYLLLWALANLMLVVAVRAGDKQGAPLQTSNLRFTVLKDDNNKPVRNASVVLHPVGKGGGQSRGGFQIKTDNEGKASSEGLPYGTLRIQVLAPGFQTFGDDYQIDKPEMEIEIRLKRPKGQYSIYDNLENKQQPAPTAPPTEPKPH
jgi:hypothetical protein